MAHACHKAWAVLEREEGNLELAGNLVKEALAINPKHGALWTVYGQIEFLNGFHLKARKVRVTRMPGLTSDA